MKCVFKSCRLGAVILCASQSCTDAESPQDSLVVSAIESDDQAVASHDAVSLLQIRAKGSGAGDGDQWEGLDQWTYNVTQPVKIVAWTGQFALNDRILETSLPTCHFEYLSVHAPKFPEGTSIKDTEFSTRDPDTDISDADVVLFNLPYLKHWGPDEVEVIEGFTSSKVPGFGEAMRLRPGMQGVTDHYNAQWDAIINFGGELTGVAKKDLDKLQRKKILPTKKRAGQIWIATCGEPVERPETNLDCSLMHDKSIMDRMDGLASYHKWSRFPTFNEPPDEEIMRRAPPDFQARGPELATATISDCQSPTRGEWFGAVVARFKELGKENLLLSYGNCSKSAEEPAKECGEETLAHWYDWFTNRCSSRPFKFVAENKDEEWYVTEKVWQAFAEGAIPVFWGTRNVLELVPPDSIVYAGDYETPAALVDRLLAFTPEDFERMRAWKQRPANEWGLYSEARRMGHFTLLPRLCEIGSAVKTARLQSPGKAGAAVRAVLHPNW